MPSMRSMTWVFSASSKWYSRSMSPLLSRCTSMSKREKWFSANMSGRTVSISLGSKVKVPRPARETFPSDGQNRSSGSSELTLTSSTSWPMAPSLSVTRKRASNCPVS